jgi:hypothetical protein
MHFLVIYGGLLALIGGCMAVWPAEMCSLSEGADDKPIPATPTNVRRMRVVGILLVVLGAALVCAGLAGVRGSDDPVLIRAGAAPAADAASRTATFRRTASQPGAGFGPRLPALG